MKLTVICTIIFLGIVGSLIPVIAQETTPRESVQGKACYTFGDDETPNLAKKKAEAFARERAVGGYRVWVESSSKVKNFQLQEDLIQTISAGMLHRVTIDQEIWKCREICLTISAEIDPYDISNEVTRRQGQQEIKDEVTSVSFTPDQAFGLKVWLDKADGGYLEGDPIIIKVKSDRNAYLKLDYFQANGKVIHLVPNFFRGQAFIEKGKTYTFGGEDSPERFIISAPFGDEVIKAMASTRPFDKALTPTGNVSESHSYVKVLKDGLAVQGDFKGKERGVRVMSGASATLYTSSREILNFKETLGK